MYVDEGERIGRREGGVPMFATVEEAEKAAAMLRRFGGVRPDVSEDFVHGERHRKIDPTPGQAYLWDWEQVADFLLARRDSEDATRHPYGR
jgi:hypothetical protein